MRSGVRAVLVSALLSFWLISSSHSTSEDVKPTHEQRLFKFLLQDYNERRLVRPVLNSSDPVPVTFSAELVGVAKVDEKEQILKTHFWVTENWYNPLLRWNPDDYGRIKEVDILPDRLWVPDVILYNNADDRDKADATNSFTTKVKVRHDGNVTWRAPAIYKSMCNIDVKYFPFDEQDCKLVFGSWQSDITAINLTKGPRGVRLKDQHSLVFLENEEWTVEAVTLHRTKVEYACCDQPFPLITISIHLSRRTYYYVMNLILPCTLIACTIFLGFILPAESGERVGLGITILLSMAVFQELTSEKLPSSSEHFPLLAMYYSVSIMEIGTALAATCVILNFHHRKTKMPNWFRKLVLVWLAKLVRFKPRCTYINAKKRAERVSCEESAAKVMKSTNSADLKLNDAYDFEFERRASLEFDTSLIETNQGHHMGVDERGPTHNGGMPSSSLARQRSLIKRSQGEKPSAHEMQIKDPLYEPFDYVREDFIRKEWQDAARVLDRVLLVVSIVIGSVSAMAIFLQSPRIREMLTP